MINRVLQTIEEHKMIAHGAHVLCAFSGGVDSSVLLYILQRLQNTLNITVSAAHLNHMLRGEDALRDELFVKNICDSYGIALICERVDINALAKKTGESVELAARHARYSFFECAAKKLSADIIATAHNANDNLETVLLNLSRGSGIEGLCGIPPVREKIIRPLIDIPRRDIEQYAAENEIAYTEDKTNAETVYSRNKLRHAAIPAMESVNDAAVANAARSTHILRNEANFLYACAQEQAERLITEQGRVICYADELLALPEALRGRVAKILSKKALKDDSYTLEFKHICDIIALAKNPAPSKSIDLPCGLVVRCEYNRLIFEERCSHCKLAPVRLGIGEFSFGKYKIKIRKMEKNEKIHNSVNTFCISCDKIKGGIFVRARREGDRLKRARRADKTLKKLFIDEKVPLTLRDTLPVIADSSGVIGVFPLGMDEKYMTDDAENALHIEIREE